MCWYKVKKQSKGGINGKNIFIIDRNITDKGKQSLVEETCNRKSYRSVDTICFVKLLNITVLLQLIPETSKGDFGTAYL